MFHLQETTSWKNSATRLRSEEQMWEKRLLERYEPDIKSVTELLNKFMNFAFFF